MMIWEHRDRKVLKLLVRLEGGLAYSDPIVLAARVIGEMTIFDNVPCVRF